MRSVLCWGAVLVCSVAASFAEDRRPPVVVELFTSEGCSSCPPADELLEKLDRNHASNYQVIALEEHVDYWNSLGWADRFSSPLFRARQTEYAQLFQTTNVYTPQMVINGRVEFVGDDSSRAAYEITRAATPPQYVLRLEPHRNSKDSSLTELTVAVRNTRSGKPEPADVYLAISETHLTTSVSRGENAGRSLHHGPVVRSFGVIGSIEARQFNEVGLKSTLKIPEDWNAGNLRATVFVQERQSRQITGAAIAKLQ